MQKFIPAGLSIALCSCAVQLTPRASKVRIVSADQKASCRFIQVISTEATLGPDKPGNALRKALNRVSELGGGSIYISSQTVDWAEGASVTGEALNCSRS